MRYLPFFLALALQAQTPTPTPEGGGLPKQSCDATDWKARVEWLEAIVAQEQSKTAGALQMYNAQIQLTGLAAKEPPKPKP